jgi:hypothetical protein
MRLLRQRDALGVTEEECKVRVKVTDKRKRKRGIDKHLHK